MQANKDKCIVLPPSSLPPLTPSHPVSTASTPPQSDLSASSFPASPLSASFGTLPPLLSFRASPISVGAGPSSPSLWTVPFFVFGSVGGDFCSWEVSEEESCPGAPELNLEEGSCVCGEGRGEEGAGGAG